MISSDLYFHGQASDEDAASAQLEANRRKMVTSLTQGSAPGRDELMQSIPNDIYTRSKAALPAHDSSRAEVLVDNYGLDSERKRHGS